MPYLKLRIQIEPHKNSRSSEKRMETNPGDLKYILIGRQNGA
jgi:hypothetical protein